MQFLVDYIFTIQHYQAQKYGQVLRDTEWVVVEERDDSIEYGTWLKKETFYRKNTKMSPRIYFVAS